MVYKLDGTQGNSGTAPADADLVPFYDDSATDSGDPTDKIADMNMAQLAAYVATKTGFGGLNNMDATDDPDANDDTGSGYEIGSMWYNQTSNALFVAESVGAAAASWTNVSATVTEKVLEDLWQAAATPILASGDKFPFADVSGTDTIGTATAPDICSTGGALLADGSATVDGVLTPDADGTRDIGLTGTRFAEIFCDDLDVTTNIIVGGTVDGRDIAADGAVLDTAFLKDGTTDLTGDLVINERADHADTPTAGKGQVWVRSDTPNVLVYTDDAGTDTVLGAGGTTEKAIEDIIEALTPAAPAATDEIVWRDVSGTDALGCSTPQQIVETAHTAMGILPQNRITTAADPGVNDDGAGTNGVVHIVNDLWTNTTTDTSWICQDITATAAVWAQIDLPGLLTGLSTGVVNGGVLSVGTPNTTFTISDGSGYVIDTTYNAPTITEVTWTGETNLTVTNLATNLITFVSIDNAGAVVQRTTRPTSTQQRSEIFLGVVVHVDKTIVDTVNNQQQPAGNIGAQLRSLADSIGFFNINGNVFSANGANLNIDKTEGDIFAAGSNYENDVEDPHALTLSSLTALTFQYRFLDGTNGVTGTAIDPDIYDLAGTSTAVPTNKFTVQRIYSFTSNNVKIQPGQVIYNNLDDAKAAISTEAFTTEPSIAANGLLRGFLVVQEGTTDLSNATTAEFLEASKFGEATGGGGGGGGGDLWSDPVDAVITPDADGTRDLAADATRFATAYVDDVHVTAGVLVTEAADHSNTPAAGKGEFWVKNDAPCTPMFTDDAGTDHTLNAAGGGSHTESAGSPLVTWDDAVGTGDLIAHQVGDTHRNTTTGNRYQCDDVTTGAAVWRVVSAQFILQGEVLGIAGSTSTGRRIRVMCPVNGTITKVEAISDQFISADASNYINWNLGSERVSGDILAADFDTNKSAQWGQNNVYDLGTLTATSANLEVQVGDLFYFDQEVVGTGNWSGVPIIVAITIDTAI